MLHLCGMDRRAIWELVRSGEYLRAYDEAMLALGQNGNDVEAGYLAVLALKRSGATGQAKLRYESLGLGLVDTAGLSGRLAEDIAALGPSLEKDLALTVGTGAKPGWAVKSAEGFGSAFARYGSSYHAVNAATMWLVAGDRIKAETAARAAMDALTPPDNLAGDDRYWEQAAEAEAAIVLGELGTASEALVRAGLLSEGQHSSRARTLRQLKMVCALLDVDPIILAPISNPSVVHYCGHRILAPGESGRFPAEDEARVSADLRDVFDRLNVGFGFGSLAAGADILAAEALLDRGAELRVVLPFDRDEFIRESVAPAGGDWVPRFEDCLSAAKAATTAFSGEFLGDPVLFDFCSRVAMGDAVIKARDLETQAHQVAVWDGVPTAGAAGTALDVARWQSGRRTSEIIEVTPASAVGPDSRSSERRRQIRGVVFGDFSGFSTLSDAQLVVFQEEVMVGLASAIEPFRPSLLSGQTWGDGIYLVLEEVTAAADCALAVQAAVNRMDFKQMGLGTLGAMRVAAHAAPVFEGRDPISGSRLFFGADVTRAARIEPTTPEGEIYVSHPFAALAELAGGESLQTQYVGTLPTAKGYGSLPLFALRKRSHRHS